MEDKTLEQEIELLLKYQKSIILWIEHIFKLIPQQVKPEYEEEFNKYLDAGTWDKITVNMFTRFIKGKHITWQQSLIFYAIDRGLSGKSPLRIAVSSGHGIGKSATMAIVLLWYLFCFYNSQVACTSPTASQMYDVLWKECQLWIYKMPSHVAGLYQWQSDYIRITDSPNTWFARARTATKDNPDALAGVHADNVAFLVDEASGVPEQVYTTSEGALTSGRALILLISNPTREQGYFFDCFHKDRINRQLLQFNSEDSPIVDWSFVDRIISKYGVDSDEYRIRVKGEFPKASGIDDRGFVPLITEDMLRFTSDVTINNGRLGVDPSGAGADSTSAVLRDTFKATIRFKEAKSTEKTIANKILTTIDDKGLNGSDIWIDNFGVGANVAVEVGLTGLRVNGVNVADEADDKERFENKRAEIYWRLREWILRGGELVGSPEKRKDLLMIKYKRNQKGKIQIMAKDLMRKEYGKSPDDADALALTFRRSDEQKKIEREAVQRQKERPVKLDPRTRLPIGQIHSRIKGFK